MNDSEILRDLIRGYDQRITELEAALGREQVRARRLWAFIVVLKGKLRAYRQAHIQAMDALPAHNRAGEGFCYRCDDDQGRGENST